MERANLEGPREDIRGGGRRHNNAVGGGRNAGQTKIDVMNHLYFVKPLVTNSVSYMENYATGSVQFMVISSMSYVKCVKVFSKIRQDRDDGFVQKSKRKACRRREKTDGTTNVNRSNKFDVLDLDWRLRRRTRSTWCKRSLRSLLVRELGQIERRALRGEKRRRQ